MAKRINVLVKYRLKKVVSELKEIQKDSKLNKIDSWNLEEAANMIQQILNEPSNHSSSTVKDVQSPS